MATPSLKNVTCPEGRPPDGDATVAVNVSAPPSATGFTDVFRATVAGVPPVTDCDTGPDALERKPASPPYWAVIVCAPAERLDVVNVACPLSNDPFTFPVPIGTPPSLNVTVPVGMPTGDVTRAVKVTGWPFEGFGEVLRPVVVNPLKFAVTVLAASMVTLPGFAVPERSPENPVKL
jgi:hypothetical protein